MFFVAILSVQRPSWQLPQPSMQHMKGAIPHASRCFLALCLGLGFLGRLPALLKAVPFAIGPLPVDPDPAAADALPPPAVAAKGKASHPHRRSNTFVSTPCQHGRTCVSVCKRMQRSTCFMCAVRVHRLCGLRPAGKACETCCTLLMNSLVDLQLGISRDDPPLSQPAPPSAWTRHQATVKPW